MQDIADAVLEIATDALQRPLSVGVARKARRCAGNGEDSRSQRAQTGSVRDRYHGDA